MELNLSVNRGSRQVSGVRSTDVARDQPDVIDDASRRACDFLNHNIAM
jgi:hypothetical protein